MNYKEYLTATLSRFNLSDADIDLIIINQGLEGGELDVKTAKMAIFKEFSLILPLANISEGGFSISWNIDALKMWYSQLANELEEVDLLNVKSDTVQDMSYLH